MKRLFPVELCLALALAASTALSASAATLTVNAGGDLQAAIDAAKPGDTIVLQAGATFNGPFKLRAKSGTTPIVIRSSTPDASLPAAGVRIDKSAAPLLAKIRSTTAGPAIKTDANANYWTLRFLEFLPSSSTSSANLVEFGAAGTSQTSLSGVPHDLVIDRCYLHGDAGFGQRRGLALNSAATQITNSYFSDFKGVLQDTQAIMGWNGPGPYLIENNYLEAAGENLMFGGSDSNIPNLVPSNITIRRNLISKPLAWMSTTWTVKNLIEFKNAQDVLVEGNTIENNWAAGQAGYSILFTPRNQSGGAPWAVTQNITIRSNVIRHVAAVFNISGWDDLHTARQTQNIAIENNLVYDVSTSYNLPNHPANGWFAIIGNAPKNVSFSHNTVDSNGNNLMRLYAGVATDGITADPRLVDHRQQLEDEHLRHRRRPSHRRHRLAQLLRAGRDGDRQRLRGRRGEELSDRQRLPRRRAVDRGLRQHQRGELSAEDDQPALPRRAGRHRRRRQLRDAQRGAERHVGPDATARIRRHRRRPADRRRTPARRSPLPGTVQFENYDAGGADIAYYDTTATNQGGKYRTNAVDIKASTDTGGGYLVGYTTAGEWLNYTVSVATAGTYAIDVRLASAGVGGTFHLEVNGVNKTGAIAVPDTGSWSTWKTVTKTGVTLAAGTQVIKVVMDTIGPSGSVANFNWFAVR